MIRETVTVKGITLGLKEIEIESSAEEAVRQSRIVLVPGASGLDIIPGDPVEISAGGDLILTGYVRDVMPSHDANDHRLEVTACSRTVDATETSVDHASGEIINQPLDKAAREFDGLGIGIESDDDLPVEPRIKIRPGETLFAAIERVSRGRGVLIHDTPEGRLRLATKPEGTHDGELAWGTHILRASATLTERGRYSPVIVRGQTSESADIDAQRFEASATDDTVTRRRPMVLTLEGPANSERVIERATWAVQRNQGEAVSLQIMVKGWRDDSGRIWQRNWLVRVVDKWLGVESRLVIKRVVLRQNDSDGTVADLELADPRALGGENPRGKSSKAYKAKSKGKAKAKGLGVDWVEFKDAREQGEWT